MERIDLQQTFQYYSNMMKNDFLMTNPEFPLNTMSLFNSYSTNPSDIEPIQVNNQHHDKNATKKNKKLRINIPNATIRRHSHLRHRRSKEYESVNNDIGDSTN